jgi:uncharacterized protein YciI
MPEFLYMVQARRPQLLTEGPTDEELEILGRHSAYLEDLARRGVVELAGRTQNTDATSFGIVVFRAENEDAARALMRDDPAVRHGIMDATLFPYKVACRGSSADSGV